jgi:hypothetical protein
MIGSRPRPSVDETGAPPTAGSFLPLLARLDDVGIIEHSRGRIPVADSGHCTDDAGRALALAARLHPRAGTLELADACLTQLERCALPTGRFVLRLDAAGRSTGDPSTDDADARAVWGLASATVSTLPPALRSRAATLLADFHRSESHHPRAAAQLIVAGGALMADETCWAWGERLVAANRYAVPQPPRLQVGWQWPEPRLTYANGLVVEALLDLAALLDVRDRMRDALALLRWLVNHETGASGQFSFTPVAGRGPDDPPGYDQQPVEAWALAGACARAATLTGSPVWIGICERLTNWFEGANDQHTRMWDPTTGASFDGLTPCGVNLNQGSESTLALIGTVHALEIAAQSLPSAAIRSIR